MRYREFSGSRKHVASKATFASGRVSCGLEIDHRLGSEQLRSKISQINANDPSQNSLTEQETTKTTSANGM
jgi:hypothetical protein